MQSKALVKSVSKSLVQRFFYFSVTNIKGKQCWILCHLLNPHTYFEKILLKYSFNFFQSLRERCKDTRRPIVTFKMQSNFWCDIICADSLSVCRRQVAGIETAGWWR